jgi:hypothetical protein
MDCTVTLLATWHAQGSPYTCRLPRRTRRNKKSASVGLIKGTKNDFVGVEQTRSAAVRRAVLRSIVSGGVPTHCNGNPSLLCHHSPRKTSGDEEGNEGVQECRSFSTFEFELPGATP